MDSLSKAILIIRSHCYPLVSVSERTLYSMRSVILSQCRDRRMGVV